VIFIHVLIHNQIELTTVHETLVVKRNLL